MTFQAIFDNIGSKNLVFLLDNSINLSQNDLDENWKSCAQRSQKKMGRSNDKRIFSGRGFLQKYCIKHDLHFAQEIE